MAGTQLVDAKRSTLFQMDPDDLVVVTEPGPYFDRRALLPVNPALVDSIAEFGVLEPILATKDGDRIVVIAGRQRVKAAREAKSRCPDLLVPVVFKRGDDVRLDGMSITENELRVDDDPITRAEKMSAYLDRVGSKGAVAVAFGCKIAAVDRTLRLLDLSAKVKAALRSGKLAASAGLEFEGLSTEEQEAKLAELLAGGSVKPTAEQVRRRRNGLKDRVRRPSKKQIATLRERVRNSYERGGADAVPIEVLELLYWIEGEMSGPDAAERAPWLARLLEEDHVDGEEVQRKGRAHSARRRAVLAPAGS